MTSAPSLTIGALAAAAGVHVETIRYYQRRGLVALPRRTPGSVRRYGPDSAARLRFIKRAQAMGFTLAEIESLVMLREQRSCKATRELAAAKLRLVEARIGELQGLRSEIAELIADCDANTEDGRCPVIERLVENGP